MKEGISILFQGKDIIYKALRRYEVLHLMHEGITINTNDAIGYIKDIKQSSFNLSYQEVFGIQSKDNEIVEEVKIPYPKVFKKMRIHNYGMDSKLDHPVF